MNEFVVVVCLFASLYNSGNTLLLSLFLRLVVVSLFVGSVTNWILFCLQIFVISSLVSSSNGLKTLIPASADKPGNKWCCSWTCMAMNPLRFAPRRRFRNVLSMRSVRLCPKINWSIWCFFACVLNSPYLRFLNSASVFFLLLILLTTISCVPSKNLRMNCSSVVLPALVWWLQCIKNRFCKLYLFFKKKLYIRHAVNMLSAPPLTATMTFWPGDTLLLSTSKHSCCCAKFKGIFLIHLIVPGFFHDFFIKAGFEKFQ